MFLLFYNMHHADKKKGTIPYVERHGTKFSGKFIPFGAKIRYLPAAERELEKREKLDASLRDGIFTGYRMHSGGRWTGQYTILDTEAYSEIAKGSNRCAYEHAISEIYIPGSSGDDQEKFPTFPAANGDVQESVCFADTEDDKSGSLDIPEDLTTVIEEAQISTTRPTTFLGSDDVYPGGDADGLESGNTETRAVTDSADRDSWSIQGDYLVRTHKGLAPLCSPHSRSLKILHPSS